MTEPTWQTWKILDFYFSIERIRKNFMSCDRSQANGDNGLKHSLLFCKIGTQFDLSSSFYHLKFTKKRTPRSLIFKKNRERNRSRIVETRRKSFQLKTSSLRKNFPQSINWNFGCQANDFQLSKKFTCRQWCIINIVCHISSSIAFLSAKKCDT